MSIKTEETAPQGLKPALLETSNGTAEAVPYPNPSSLRTSYRFADRRTHHEY